MSPGLSFVDLPEIVSPKVFFVFWHVLTIHQRQRFDELDVDPVAFLRAHYIATNLAFGLLFGDCFLVKKMPNSKLRFITDCPCVGVQAWAQRD